MQKTDATSHGTLRAYVGARVHDGRRFADAQALLLDGRTARLGALDALPAGCIAEDLGGGIVLPGFVDLQVNGGGGVMLGDAPSVDTVRVIAAAHRGLGTAALLPTLITDRPAQVEAAVDAVEAAIAEGVPGVIGLHLEGPHISLARKGAHDAALIREMTPEDVRFLTRAVDRVGNLKVTLAPEAATPRQIAALAEAGVLVSLGHTDADFDTCLAAFDAGARCVTHLFNAMSPFGSRAPGLVGAALLRGDVHAGIIADGVHVHPGAVRVALAAKQGPGDIFLVTDAMAVAGTGRDGFDLGGRRVVRSEGSLRLGDGTLAGADLEMRQALSVLVRQSGEDPERAIARACAGPAGLLACPGGVGGFGQGHAAMALHLSEDLTRLRVLQ